MGQADLSLGDGTLAPYPGLAATLAHGMDFFDRPAGVVIPQFASSLSASLGGPSSDGTQDSQAPSPDQNAAPVASTITSSRDYDHFSDPVASPAATSPYDGFSDAVGRVPPGVLSSGAAASSQASWRPSPELLPVWHPAQPSADALASAEEVARADPFYADPAQNAEVFKGIKQLPKDADDAARAAANILTFGQADRLAAYLETNTGIGGVSGDYDANLEAEQYRTEHANSTAAAIGSFAGFGLGAGATNALLRGGRAVAGELLPYASRIVPQFGRLTRTAEEAEALAQDAKLAGNAAQGASDGAGEVGAANSSNAVATEAAGRGASAAAETEASATDALDLEKALPDESGVTPRPFRFMKKWNAEDRAAADMKALQLRSLPVRRAPPAPRPPCSAAKVWKDAGREIPPGHDVDHIVDLQLDGTHTLDNMQLLPSTVNRSLGAQVANRIKNLPIGTLIKGWTIGDE